MQENKMASSNAQDSKMKNKTVNSKELMDFPVMKTSLQSKLLLSEQRRQLQGPPTTFKIEKPSVLNRVQTFLPLMAEADQRLKEDLARLPSGSMDIENVDEDKQHVEMSLALVANEYDSDSPTELSSSSESEESDYDEIKTEYVGSLTQDNLVIKKHGKKPVIEVLKTEESGQNNNKIDTVSA